MNIIIAGDLVPTETNYDLFKKGIDDLVDKPLLDIVMDSDIRIFNLETPLCDEKNPIPKIGPNLIAPTDTIKGISDLKPSLLGMANNHILDQGDEGLIETIKTLDKHNIVHIGAGENLAEASKPYIFEYEGLKVGVYACAENEFTIATDKSRGANPFDPFESLDHIEGLKKKCDYVIVLYHGGKEHYRYPSPYLRKVCRKIADKGADLVVCQHSHCIGCKEEYKNSTIVYGQGNFLFDHSNIECWQTSLVLSVNIKDKLTVSYIPICKDGNRVRMPSEAEALDILNGFETRTIEIQEENFIEENYIKLIQGQKESYVKYFIGEDKEVKSLSKVDLMRMLNVIRCEAHNEVIKTGIKELLREGF